MNNVNCGFAILILVGASAAAPMNNISCGFLLLILVSIMLALVVYESRGRKRGQVQLRDQARKAVEGLISQVALEFPDEVQAWGGARVLYEPEVVETLLRDLREPDTASPSAETVRNLPETAPRRARMLRSMLEGLRKSHLVLAGKRGCPLPRILLVTLVACWIAGHLFGEIRYSVRHPREGFFNIAHGQEFDRPVVYSAVIVGEIAAITVLSAQFWFWKLGVRRKIANVDERIGRLNSEFPDSVRAWGGPDALRERPVPERLLADSKEADDLLDPAAIARQRQTTMQALLDLLAKRLRSRDEFDHLPLVRMAAIALPVGWLFGHLFGELVYMERHPYFHRFPPTLNATEFDPIPLTAGLAFGFVIAAEVFVGQWLWRRYFHAQEDSAAKALAALVQKEFAGEVRSWGGPTLLHDPGAVAELSRSVTATA
jgi:hypothetical protein